MPLTAQPMLKWYAAFELQTHWATISVVLRVYRNMSLVRVYITSSCMLGMLTDARLQQGRPSQGAHGQHMANDF